jgi:hypothetical protein
MDSSSAKAPPKHPAPLLQELDELYVALRGSPYVTALYEAKKAFLAKNYFEALRMVRNTGELHHRAHLYLLQSDPAAERRHKEEAEKIAAKRAKLKSILERFEDVVQRLDKLARVQSDEPQALVSPMTQKQIDAHPEPAVSEAFREQFRTAADEAAQLRIIHEWFHLQPVSAEKSLQLGALYCLRNQGQFHLLRYKQRNAAMATLGFESVVTGKSLKPIELEVVLGLGAKELLHRMLPKPQPAPIDDSDTSDDYTVSIINKGSFTQLQMAAQATGLLSNADAIGFIRDHEFRIKKYQEAFDRVEGLFIHLRTAADQRTQRLRQEEINYKSGVLRMSPKEWLMKQQRETALTQLILRALRYFTKVMDGLRILQTTPEAAPRDEPTVE